MAKVRPRNKEREEKKTCFDISVTTALSNTSPNQEKLIKDSSEQQPETCGEESWVESVPTYRSFSPNENENYDNFADGDIFKGFLSSDGLMAIECTHWLEILDPLHRYGTFLRPYYDAWLSIGAPESFFSWLDDGDGVEVDLDGAIGFSGKVVPRGVLESSRVWYCNERERERHRVIVHDRMLVWASDDAPFGRGEMSPVQTESDVKWIFVIDVSKELYICRKRKGSFHHSSFTAGGAVLAAGRINVDNGNIVCIGPNSGHYRTTWEQLLLALEDFFGESGLQVLPPVRCRMHNSECVRVVSQGYSGSYLGRRFSMEG